MPGARMEFNPDTNILACRKRGSGFNQAAGGFERGV
jgi:hypothetical protein